MCQIFSMTFLFFSFLQIQVPTSLSMEIKFSQYLLSLDKMPSNCRTLVSRHNHASFMSNKFRKAIMTHSRPLSKFKKTKFKENQCVDCVKCLK